MTSDAEPLQGSLFGDKTTVPESIKSAQKDYEPSNKALSEAELVADAKSRPRPRKIDTNENPGPSTCSQAEGKNILSSDLPRWSHHKLVDKEQLTPVLRHYVDLKSANPDRVLLYRLGDFFECFFEDAIKLSKLLEITLTGKDGGKTLGRVPMAGIPHHASDRYCADLIKHGLSVAICDQLEAIPTKGSLLKRGITRVLTPGTVIEEGMLQSRRNNWLAAVIAEPAKENKPFSWGLATADISTGEFVVSEGKESRLLHQELSKLEASEVIWSNSSELNNQKNWCPERLEIKSIASTPFSHPEAEMMLKKHFQLNTINGLGLQDLPFALRASGGLLAYLKDTKAINSRSSEEKREQSVPLDFPKITFPGDSLVLDAQTRRNLELTATQKDNQFQGSLLWAIDRTLTAMGGRCLRRWIEAPLLDVVEIRARQTVVSNLVAKKALRHELRRILRAMSDLERLAGRAGAGQAGARDIVAIADGLERLPQLAQKLQAIRNDSPNWFLPLLDTDQDLIQLATTIRHDLISNPPLSLSEGGLIHDGIDPILDGLRNQLDDQDSWLRNQEILERKLSGNANLRLQHHRTFGYFIAVSKAKSENVPDHWIRRQTLANEERFITPSLKAREGKIFEAKARASEREYELFCKLREIVGTKASAIRKAARAVAGLDALTGLAEVAATNSYCQPEILDTETASNSRKIHIQGSRHPVVEQILADELFQPNDVLLGADTDLIILTGPNASGKSCYLRQVGLVQLLAQIGSWVPANKACVSITDQIFTRVGAVDDLAAGQSTFMVEMTETAYILNQATSQSLVLLDEIGRGTATFDGLSIAWAVSEFLAHEVKCRSIFATHYHELNELSKSFNNVSNFQVLVEETGKDLLFLHKITPGGASRSYGIEAARLAGVPSKVIQRSRQILEKLQQPNNKEIPNAA